MLVNRLVLAVINFQLCKELSLNSGIEKKCSSMKCDGDGDGEKFRIHLIIKKGRSQSSCSSCFGRSDRGLCQ